MPGAPVPAGRGGGGGPGVGRARRGPSGSAPWRAPRRRLGATRGDGDTGGGGTRVGGDGDGDTTWWCQGQAGLRGTRRDSGPGSRQGPSVPGLGPAEVTGVGSWPGAGASRPPGAWEGESSGPAPLFVAISPGKQPSQPELAPAALTGPFGTRGFGGLSAHPRRPPESPPGAH